MNNREVVQFHHSPYCIPGSQGTARLDVRERERVCVWISDDETGGSDRIVGLPAKFWACRCWNPLLNQGGDNQTGTRDGIHD